MSDIIERYDAAERAGRARVPNRAIEAFQLEAFTRVGYPFRISSLDELWRYHDVMQEGRFERNLNLLGDVDLDEVRLCSRAAELINEFSNQAFGAGSPGRHALTRSLLQYRMIKRHLTHQSRPWSIFEVGPGSGYLGLLLGLDGHTYFALEASQAFFIYQHELYSFAFGHEYADRLRLGTYGRISHIPWWEFNAAGFALPHCDVATCNHALAEMHPNAVRRLVRLLARTAGGEISLLAETLGSTVLRSEATVLGLINEEGYEARELAPRNWVFSSALSAPATTSHFSSSLASRLWARVPSGVQRRAQLLVTFPRRLTKSQGTAEGGSTQIAHHPLHRVFNKYGLPPTADERYVRGDW